MANIDDWRDAFRFLRDQINNEFMNVNPTSPDVDLLKQGIIDAFTQTAQEIGIEPFDE